MEGWNICFTEVKIKNLIKTRSWCHYSCCLIALKNFGKEIEGPLHLHQTHYFEQKILSEACVWKVDFNAKSARSISEVKQINFVHWSSIPGSWEQPDPGRHHSLQFYWCVSSGCAALNILRLFAQRTFSIHIQLNHLKIIFQVSKHQIKSPITNMKPDIGDFLMKYL